MGDTREIKAKVTVEYDGSGVSKAKEDLSSLADIVGGQLAESTGNASDGLASLDEQMGGTAESTRALTSSVGALEKPMAASGDAIVSVSEALGEHQALLGEAGDAYEALQKPVEATTALLGEASPPMLAIAKSAESMQAQMSNAGDGFTQVQESLSQSVPLLPQFAEGLHGVSEELAPQAKSFDAYTENIGAFQDALVNPSPFSMIQQHLKETGQTWDDFTSSIGDSNIAVLHDMATNADVTHSVMGGIGKDVQSVGQVFTESASATDEFTQAYNSLGKTIAEPGVSGGGLFESFGQGSAGGLFGGIMEGMNKIAMPIMAAQMIGMAVGAAATGIYNMAALAEGPAAHGVGTFTGAIDQLGQHAQETAQTFSESFGKGLLPSIDAINNVMATSNESDFWSNLGSGLGTVTGVLGDATQILGGGLIGGLMKTLTLNPGNTTGESWIAAGWEGLQNTWAGITGQAEPFPGPGYASGPNVNMPQIQQQLAQNTAMMNAQASNPQYLAAQAYLQTQSSDAKIGQTIYDAGHMTGMDVFDYTPQAYQRSMMSQVASMPYAQRGISDVDINRAFFASMDTSNAPLSYPGVDANWNHPSCFPAGTRVLMADGREQAIETLQIGDRVLAHNGTKQMVATILARIKPPPKRVYTLTLSDATTLTLTNSHPVATTHGWKALFPARAKEENPDLEVTALLPGDIIHTVDGVCTLQGIELGDVVQIYNITVSEPHTFYADGVLVHNKGMSEQIMQQVADTTIPHTDLKGSNLIDSLASNFSGASMAHTFTATVNWAAEGLEKGFTAVASWAATGLAQDFLAVASWAATGLQQAYTATVNWASQGLSQAYTAVANWTAQNLEKPFMAVASWAATGLQQAYTAVANWTGENLIKPFTAAASWAAEGLEHSFEGVTNWIGQNLEHTFTGIASWVGQNLNMNFSSGGMTPGFASGVQNFGGGWAVTSEGGPELVYLPQGASVYPHSAGLTPLSMGDNSSGGMITVNVTHLITLDGRVIAQGTIPYLAPMARAASGRRQ